MEACGSGVWSGSHPMEMKLHYIEATRETGQEGLVIYLENFHHYTLVKKLSQNSNMGLLKRNQVQNTPIWNVATRRIAQSPTQSLCPEAQLLKFMAVGTCQTLKLEGRISNWIVFIFRLLHKYGLASAAKIAQVNALAIQI